MPPAESPTAFKDEGLNSRWAEAAAEEAPSSDEPLQEESTDDSTMSLNVAYEALETVRTLNLQAEFGESVKLDDCLLCLRDPPPPIRGFRGQRVKAFLNKKPTSCLTCGTHVCGTHRSAEFWKQSIVVCNDCAPLFSVPFMLEQVTLLDQSIRKKNMNHILEVYDRALILLKYSGQFIPDVAEALEANTSRHNKIGLGTSATGVLSGVVGVAAAGAFPSELNSTIYSPLGFLSLHPLTHILLILLHYFSLQPPSLLQWVHRCLSHPFCLVEHRRRSLPARKLSIIVRHHRKWPIAS